MKLTGSQILLESLKKEGVDTIFGLPGGVVLGIFDALYHEKALKVILTRHEQGAMHMGEGYAKVTGKAGVVLVTSGPGATNTVTGLTNAYMDSCPLVVITGQVPTQMIGNDAFQEADIVGISRPCTKYSFLVKDVKDLAQIIKEAFYIATTGRPGPVLIDLPKDVTFAKTEFKYPDKVSIRSYNPTIQGNKWQVKQAALSIAKAKRPVLYVGGGVVLSNAYDEIKELAELTQIPVTMTLMGLGAFPGTHPLSLGMLGMHGLACANWAVHDCDLLIAVGARFDDRVTGKVSEFAPNCEVIHIDIDPTSIRKNFKVDVPIVGDVKSVLKELNEVIKNSFIGNEDLKALRKPWMAQIGQWKKERPLQYHQEADVIKPQFVIEKLYELTKGNAIVTTDVGQHQMWAAQFYKFNQSRTFLNSGGLGTMGYGFPAALGAQAAFPEKLVINISGDGSIQMNIQELATAVVENLPVKVAILNNRYLGMVRQWQQLFYENRYSSSYLDQSPDFVKLAEAYGAVGLRASRPDEVEGVILKALKVKGPVVMDFVVDSNENVYPMVPAGGSNYAMVFEDPKPVQEDKPARLADPDSILTA
ncbi:MAG: biosynthetic-type acetolactate synthase large subunit [Nitrospirae bacterium]|nr:biosynthetic-type acetolactate synthase large subunit [Nitrospirota bacterium]MBI3351706.1 biosynthetic-type acetolactate synthase large subunit [Nitrospirota bacterium]